MKSKLTLVFIFLCINIVYSQGVSCGDILNNARQSFDGGHFYGIPAMLKPCLDKGFSKSQKIVAYRLLTRTYLYLDDPISAEDSYLKLLKIDPEYTVSEEKDPIDLVYLSQKFTTTPIFVLFAKAGVSTSFVSIINNYGVDNTASSLENYSSGFGFQLAIGSEFNINNQFSLGLELNFNDRTYDYENRLFLEDIQTLKESQLGVEVPLYFKYKKRLKNTQPFAYIGIAPHFLFSAKGDLKLIDQLTVNNENSSEIPVTGPKETLTPIRSSTTLSALIGGGINYKVGYDYLTFDLRFQYGMSNIVNIDNQFQNSNLLYKYGYVDDDKTLNTLSFSIGYIKPLYKPRMKKKGSPVFLRKIFKRKAK